MGGGAGRIRGHPWKRKEASRTSQFCLQQPVYPPTCQMNLAAGEGTDWSHHSGYLRMGLPTGGPEGELLRSRFIGLSFTNTCFQGEFGI